VSRTIWIPDHGASDSPYQPVQIPEPGETGYISPADRFALASPDDPVAGDHRPRASHRRAPRLRRRGRGTGGRAMSAPTVAELEVATAATAAAIADPAATLADVLATAEAEEAAYSQIFSAHATGPSPNPNPKS